MAVYSILVIATTLILGVGQSAAQISQGYATYSNGDGGVCSGVSSSLPTVSLNAAQFANGAACGQCVQISGTGNGAGKDPVSQAPYIAVITNVCPQCSYGDIDLQESGDGKFGITWSFVGCPGAGRKLIEQPFNGDKTVYVVRGHADQTPEHGTESQTKSNEESATEVHSEESVTSLTPVTDATTSESSTQLQARELSEETQQVEVASAQHIDIVSEPESEDTQVANDVPAEENQQTEETSKLSRRLMRA